MVVLVFVHVSFKYLSTCVLLLLIPHAHSISVYIVSPNYDLSTALLFSDLPPHQEIGMPSLSPTMEEVHSLCVFHLSYNAGLTSPDG